MRNKPTPEQAWRSDYQIGYDNGVASQAAEIERLTRKLAKANSVIIRANNILDRMIQSPPKDTP